MLIICSSIASFGSYAPLFFMSQHGFVEGYDVQDLVLLQTFLGLSIAFGIVASGSTINKNFTISYRKINISRQYVCQVSTIFMLLSLLHVEKFAVFRSYFSFTWNSSVFKSFAIFLKNFSFFEE